MKEKIRIGCGAGFSGDRIEPALILTEKGNLDYLVLECLAERTIALAQKRKLQNPEFGYDVLLEKRLNDLLPLLPQYKTRLVTNMGAANPIAGAKRIIELAKSQNLSIKVAAVFGDDVLEFISGEEHSLENNRPVQSEGKLLSANAYLGVEAILPALASEADIIITGRVADPSLFLAPMIYEFDWGLDQFELLGKGTVLGHLLECAGQLTGGYFADPVSKPIPGLDQLGHPFVDVFPDGRGIISKVEGTGGVISQRNAKEQLLYEVLDPHHYITPDVVADFSTVQFEEIAFDQLQVTGGGGIERPKKYKVSVGYEAGFKGEGEISYAGSHAVERARLAGEIIEKRVKGLVPNLRVDLIGLNSLHPNDLSKNSNPYEVRLRVAGMCKTLEQAQLIGEEVEALYTNGPAGGGGARKMVTQVVGVVSTLLDRNQIKPDFQLLST